MTITPHTNNGVNGFRIIDEQGEYFLTDATEQLAIEKYNSIKLKKANPSAPSYRELRAQEYPSIQDQLDMQYWDKVNGTNVWGETINAIKLKYPKT